MTHHRNLAVLLSATAVALCTTAPSAAQTPRLEYQDSWNADATAQQQQLNVQMRARPRLRRGLGLLIPPPFPGPVLLPATPVEGGSVTWGPVGGLGGGGNVTWGPLGGLGEGGGSVTWGPFGGVSWSVAPPWIVQRATPTQGGTIGARESIDPTAPEILPMPSTRAREF